MENQNIRGIFETLEAAKEQLGHEYRFPDAKFIDEKREAIEDLKELYKNKGGVHVVSVDEGDEHYGVIIRVPSREDLDEVYKGASDKKKSVTSHDLKLLGKALIWPHEDVVRSWIDGPAPGIAGPLSKEILSLAKANQEAVSKKL